MDCGRSGEQWKQREREYGGFSGGWWWKGREERGGGYALDRQATGLEPNHGCGQVNHLSTGNLSPQSMAALQAEYNLSSFILDLAT